MRHRGLFLMATLSAGAWTGHAVFAQQQSVVAPSPSPTSSLYMQPVEPIFPQHIRPGEVVDTLSPALKNTSLVAVKVPEPRQFGVHDLITIVVSESATNASTASIDTEKDARIDMALDAFIQLNRLLELQVQPTPLASGKPQVKANARRSFSGDGSHRRQDSLTTRITAQVIDVKPNGNLVVEARKYIRTDSESTMIVLTGICRAIDVRGDNTINSTLLHDLRVVKEHTGELRKATRKGLLTRFFEGLFNF